MDEKTSLRVRNPCSDNRKSKIQNRKWAGLFAIVLALTMCGARAEAQQTGKIFRIGFLDSSTASGMAGLLEAFRQELSKLGWIEGETSSSSIGLPSKKNERLPELAAELVGQKVELIVVNSVASASATKSVTTSIPIVMAAGSDPVAARLIASLARPSRTSVEDFHR